MTYNTYSTDLAATDLSDLLDDYYATKALLTTHAEHVEAGTNTPADDREAALRWVRYDALINEIVKRAEESQR